MSKNKDENNNSNHNLRQNELNWVSIIYNSSIDTRNKTLTNKDNSIKYAPQKDIKNNTKKSDISVKEDNLISSPKSKYTKNNSNNRICIPSLSSQKKYYIPELDDKDGINRWLEERKKYYPRSKKIQNNQDKDEDEDKDRKLIPVNVSEEIDYIPNTILELDYSSGDTTDDDTTSVSEISSNHGLSKNIETESTICGQNKHVQQTVDDLTNKNKVLPTSFNIIQNNSNISPISEQDSIQQFQSKNMKKSKQHKKRDKDTLKLLRVFGPNGCIINPLYKNEYHTTTGILKQNLVDKDILPAPYISLYDRLVCEDLLKKQDLILQCFSYIRKHNFLQGDVEDEDG